MMLICFYLQPLFVCSLLHYFSFLFLSSSLPFHVFLFRFIPFLFLCLSLHRCFSSSLSFFFVLFPFLLFSYSFLSYVLPFLSLPLFLYISLQPLRLHLYCLRSLCSSSVLTSLLSVNLACTGDRFISQICQDARTLERDCTGSYVPARNVHEHLFARVPSACICLYHFLTHNSTRLNTLPRLERYTYSH
jgi:hypothetical protein